MYSMKQLGKVLDCSSFYGSPGVVSLVYGITSEIVEQCVIALYNRSLSLL